MQNKYQINIYTSAQADLTQIFDYIATTLDNPSAAIKQIEDFENAFENISVFPQSCPFVKNEYVKDRTLRKLVVNNYIAFYRLKDNEIQIVRVLYGMRKIEELL